ncbi:solute carrier family 22 member 3-like isoform X2 [Belonocnema kinseyi]|nr:solute carrier family 22 member 3-like isoform X2 [Belonocnema kinseyi]
MVASFVILMEICGPKWRPILSVLFHLPFILGHLMLPLISYLTRTWYGFQLAISIPSIFLISYYWVIPESPRWLLAVGKNAEATEVLRKAAKKNGISLDKVTATIDIHEKQIVQNQRQKKNKYNMTHLFRTPNMRLRSICVCANWFVCGMCFFGLAQYMGQLDGNIFVNVTASAAIELPGTILVLLLISHVSRLKILIGGHLLSGISLLLITIVPHATAKFCLANLGIVGVTMSFPTVYLYSSEIYPTVLRNIGVGLGSVCARLGSIIAPYIATMGTVRIWLPPLIFGFFSVVVAGMCFILPETTNSELPETIEDGENFGKEKSTESASCDIIGGTSL